MSTFTPVRPTTAAVSSRREAGSWRDDALCAQVDTDMFFPGKGENGTDAKAICAMCPVKAACIDSVMRAEGLGGLQHRHGVWGGLNPTERLELSKTWRFKR